MIVVACCDMFCILIVNGYRGIYTTFILKCVPCSIDIHIEVSAKIVQNSVSQLFSQ